MMEPIITRIEDMPYYRCPVVQFSLSQSASLNFGQYIWSPATAPRVALTGAEQVTQASLFYFRSVSFSADIPELDYQQALQITTTVAANNTVAGTNQIPKYFKFLQSDANAPTLRNPILCQQYVDNQDYRLIVEPKQLPNVISGFFRGALQQTGALAGINTITLTAEFYAQVIESRNFINALKNEYPQLSQNGYAVPKGGRR